MLVAMTKNGAVVESEGNMFKSEAYGAGSPPTGGDPH